MPSYFWLMAVDEVSNLASSPLLRKVLVEYGSRPERIMPSYFWLMAG